MYPFSFVLKPSKRYESVPEKIPIQPCSCKLKAYRNFFGNGSIPPRSIEQVQSYRGVAGWGSHTPKDRRFSSYTSGPKSPACPADSAYTAKFICNLQPDTPCGIFLWGRLCPYKLRTNQIMLSSQAPLPTFNFLAPPLTIIIGMQSDTVCQIKKDKINQSIIIGDICFQWNSGNELKPYSDYSNK